METLTSQLEYFQLQTKQLSKKEEKKRRRREVQELEARLLEKNKKIQEKIQKKHQEVETLERKI